MALRGSSLADEEAVQALFQRVISSLTLEGNYLILLAHDTYDVPYRAKDGERMDDASDQVFSYIPVSYTHLATPTSLTIRSSSLISRTPERVWEWKSSEGRKATPSPPWTM